MSLIQQGDKVRVHRQPLLKGKPNGPMSIYVGWVAFVNDDGSFNVWYLDKLGSSHCRQNLTIGTKNDQIQPWH